jgi:hypothetical protein
MGTECYLFKPKTGERFNLGKGRWSELFPSVSFSSLRPLIQIGDGFDDEFDLYRCMLKELAVDFDKSLTLGFFWDLSLKIFDWCKEDKFEFWSEQAFFNYYTAKWRYSIDETYPITGTRYFGGENGRE